jgi:hypothetical protein
LIQGYRCWENGLVQQVRFFIKAVLKVIVDLLMLIGAEGAILLREDGAGETPKALKRRGGSSNRPRKAKCLERKSTGKFNTAFIKKTFA